MKEEYHNAARAQGSTMKQLKVVTYNPHHHGNEYIDGVIECYQKSFAGHPWNESHVCGGCGKVIGETELHQLHRPLSCPLCQGQLTEFWPHQQVRSDFLEETTEDVKKKKFVSSWAAVLEGRVVGICWGYTLSPEALAEKVELPDLSKQIYERFGSETQFVSYQDELAVVPEYREIRFAGKSIARRLVEAQHQDFLKYGAGVGILRTLSDPPTKVYQWYTKVGFEQIAAYKDNPGRVILGCCYDTLTY